MGTEANTATTAQGYDTALSISDLTVSANTERGRFDVIDRVALTRARGQVTGLAGESGSGKTVTALSAMQLLEPKVLRVEDGSISLGDQDLLLATLAMPATSANVRSRAVDYHEAPSRLPEEPP